MGLAAALLVLAAAPAALAGGGSSGVYDQYTEQIPTAGGNQHSGGSGGPGTTGGGSGGSGGSAAGSVVLPANLKADGGKDAKTLREVATSPKFGAPDKTLPLPDSTSSPASVSAALNAVTDGSDGRMVGLFVALLAITAVSLGFAAARRRGI